MADFGQDLYETRTNLFSCDNIIEYLWRRCGKNSYPFKPENTSDIQTKPLSSVFVGGREILEDYQIALKDQKNAGLKRGTDYNLDICAFQTLNIQDTPITAGYLALIYKPDRRYYTLFLIEEGQEEERKTMKLLMKVKQKVGLFGSFETEMINFY